MPTVGFQQPAAYLSSRCKQVCVPVYAAVCATAHALSIS